MCRIDGANSVFCADCEGMGEGSLKDWVFLISRLSKKLIDYQLQLTDSGFPDQQVLKRNQY